MGVVHLTADGEDHVPLEQEGRFFLAVVGMGGGPASGRTSAAGAPPSLGSSASPLHVSGRAAMQLGEFYVRGSVTFDRCALCFGQLTPDLARHPGDQHSLRDLLSFDVNAGGDDRNAALHAFR